MLIDPATQTPIDKAWGAALWKQVTEDKSGHLRPQEQLAVGALLWDSGGFISSARQLAWAKSLPLDAWTVLTNTGKKQWDLRKDLVASATSTHCIFILEIKLQRRLLKNACKWNKEQALCTWLMALASAPADTDLSHKTVAGLRPEGKM